MSIKKSELKKILMPIVQECVEEVINERVMASIIKEVASGVAQGMTVLAEQRTSPKAPVEQQRRAIYEAVETPSVQESDDPDKYRIPKFGERDPYAEKKMEMQAQKAEEGRKRIIESLGGRGSVYGEMFASAEITDQDIESELVTESLLDIPEATLAKSGLNPKNVAALTSEGTSLDLINALMGRG